jgi:peptide/nickel transport system ATP-binding protein
MAAPLLVVDDLSVSFTNAGEVLSAVRGVSFRLDAGRTLCLVGESGSGKSVTAMALLGLLPPRSAQIDAADISLAGESLLHIPPSRLCRVRGGEISMIFQDAMTSLNPALTVGYQIAEAIRLHDPVSRGETRKRVLDMLDRVRIADPARRIDAYPHQLSGGMRQRAMIAMALACRPKVLIADEPTTALDVTVQAQILALIDELKREYGTAVLFITHDLGVVAEIADEVAVMYAGRIVEQGPVEEIFDRPAHGYTAGLLNALAVPGSGMARGRLAEIPGSVPSLARRPPGCAFAPRCAFAETRCSTSVPPIEEIAPNHRAACIRHAAVQRASARRIGTARSHDG